MWVGEIKPNQAISSPCLLFIWVVVIGPILVSIDLIAFAMAMAISAEQPVMPSSLAAKLREQGGTWQVAITILYIVYVIQSYIYTYRVAPLSENVQSFRNFHLKTSVTLHLPCVSAIRDVIRWLL